MAFPHVRSRVPQVVITHGFPIATAKHRLWMAVVLELQPVVVGINQEKGVVLQYIAAIAQLGLHAKSQSCPLGSIPQGLPGGKAGEDQPEMAGVDPPLRWLGNGGGELGHKLVPPQIEDQGLWAAAPQRAPQTLHIPPLSGGQVCGGNGEVETGNGHGPEIGRSEPIASAKAGDVFASALLSWGLSSLGWIL